VRLAGGFVLAAILNLWLMAALARAFDWLRCGRIDYADVLRPVALWAGVTVLSIGALRAAGITLWLLLGFDAVALIWALATTLRTIVRGNGRLSSRSRLAPSLTLFAASLSVTLIGAEALLLALERHPVEKASLELKALGVKAPPDLLRRAFRRQALLTFPPELARVPLRIEDATVAYRWHGAVHVEDVDGFRRTLPFPAKRDGLFRIMAVGDSLTYGVGIDERWTYAHQLESLLARTVPVEVLNLGVSGANSEDIVALVRRFLPSLRPDLVVWGVCHNDFLPSGRGQYANEAYAFPLPESVKSFFSDRSRLARLAGHAYEQALLGLGLRIDFYDDILSDFEGHQLRFSRDVAELSALVRAQGLPPVVTLVLDQYPDIGSRAHRITQIAVGQLEDAGMDVIGTAPFYRQLDGRRLNVSRWEGHPNEIANAIWAAMLDRHIRMHGYLDASRGAGPQP